MKRCLADINVLLALLAGNHDHHALARTWAEGLTAGQVGICRFVQLALIRLLGNTAIMGTHALSARAAWDMIEQELLADERFEYLPEPPSLGTVFPTLLRYPAPTNKLTGDAYLAAFAIASQRQIVTLDTGFRQFRDLDVRILRSN